MQIWPAESCGLENRAGMPSREILAQELSAMLKAIAHPDRVRLIEEIRSEALDVSALSERLGIPPARVSQHLAILKSHHLAEERREGRFHHYSLPDPELARWLLEGVKFIELRLAAGSAAIETIEAAKTLWGTSAPAE